MKIEFNQKQYEIPERIGLLPYKKYMAIQKLKPNSEDDNSIYEFNINYLSILLDEPLEVFENMAFEEFIKLLTIVNTNLLPETKLDNVQDEINKPE